MIENAPYLTAHIGVSCAAFAVLCVAALQSIMLAWQNNLIRRKPNSSLLNILPPLQVMERRLFQMIILGFVLLSLVLISSLWFFAPWQSLVLVEKTVLAICSWGIFAGLLLGRYFYGWRGPRTLRLTIIGVLLVLVCCVILAFQPIS